MEWQEDELLNVIHSAIALLICVVLVYEAMDEQFSTQQVMEQNGGPVWEALWPCTCTLDILQIRVTAKAFHDAKKYGSHAELFFLKLRRGTDPIEPGHVSTESLLFTFPFAQVDVKHPARNDPLSKEALGGSWPRASGVRHWRRTHSQHVLGRSAPCGAPSIFETKTRTRSVMERSHVFLHSPPRLIRMGCVKATIVPTESSRSDHQGCWSSVTPKMHVVSIDGDIFEVRRSLSDYGSGLVGLAFQGRSDARRHPIIVPAVRGAFVPKWCFCWAYTGRRAGGLQVLQRRRQRDVSVLETLRQCLVPAQGPFGATLLFSSQDRAPRVWSVAPPDH